MVVDYKLKLLGCRVRLYDGGLEHAELIDLICGEIEHLPAGRGEVQARLESDPFCGGFWFNSNYLHDALLAGAAAEYRPAEINFFNPLLFSRSILNSVPAAVNRRFGLRGYGASYIDSYHYPLFNEMEQASVSFAFLAGAYRVAGRFYLVSMLLERSESAALRCSLEESGAEAKKNDFAIDIFGDIGNNHGSYDDIIIKCSIENIERGEVRGLRFSSKPSDELLIFLNN